MSVTLPPPPPPPNDETSWEWEYEYLLEDIELAAEEGNRKYGIGKATVAVAVNKSRLDDKDRSKCLAFLQAKLDAADPEKKANFLNIFSGVDECK
jgi:hypothetical protein